MKTIEKAGYTDNARMRRFRNLSDITPTHAGQHIQTHSRQNECRQSIPTQSGQHIQDQCGQEVPAQSGQRIPTQSGQHIQDQCRRLPSMYGYFGYDVGCQLWLFWIDVGCQVWLFWI